MHPKNKLWCVYGWDLPLQHIGRVSQEDRDTIYVKYADDEDEHPWDQKWVKRFETIGEAIDYTVSNGLAKFEVMRKVERDFPKLFRANYPNINNVNMDRIL